MSGALDELSNINILLQGFVTTLTTIAQGIRAIGNWNTENGKKQIKKEIEKLRDFVGEMDSLYTKLSIDIEASEVYKFDREHFPRSTGTRAWKDYITALDSRKPSAKIIREKWKAAQNEAISKYPRDLNELAKIHDKSERLSNEIEAMLALSYFHQFPRLRELLYYKLGPERGLWHAEDEMNRIEFYHAIHYVKMTTREALKELNEHLRRQFQ